MTKFEQKARALKPSEIIFTMIDGLENPVTEINMSTFGAVNNGICFGCAATNTICKIGEYDLKDLSSFDKTFYYKDINSKENLFLDSFESAINTLRQGDINHSNKYFNNIGLSEIETNENIKLPVLYTDNYLQNLEPYRQLAKYNKSIGN
jgi:hypothetical protein